MSEIKEGKHRKVFISVLGTGLYEKCNYVRKDQDFISSKTLFVQQATLEYLQVATQWNEDDVGLFLLTNKARTANWDKSITSRFDRFKEQDCQYSGLEAIIANMNLPIQIKDLDIVDGNNEKEIWSIFKTVFDVLQNGDHLYFDVTHAFRSIPMLILVLCNYAKFLKKAEIKSITYGNYEGRDIALNQAPLIDLLPLANLQDWTYAAGAYLDTGNVKPLKALCLEGIKPILKTASTDVKDEHFDDAKLLEGFVKYLDDVAQERLTCRGQAIIYSESFKKLKAKADEIAEKAKADENADQAQADEIPETGNEITKAAKISEIGDANPLTPFAPLIAEIERSFDYFDTNDNVCNAYAAAKWCYDNKLYQQATTILQEGVISLFCKSYQIPIDDVDAREDVTIAFKIAGQRFPSMKSNSHGVTLHDFFKVNEMLKDPCFQDDAIVNAYNELTNIRNDYNHSGMRTKPKSPKKLVELIEDSIVKLAPLFH